MIPGHGVGCQEPGMMAMAPPLIISRAAIDEDIAIIMGQALEAGDAYAGTSG